MRFVLMPAVGAKNGHFLCAVLGALQVCAMGIGSFRDGRNGFKLAPGSVLAVLTGREGR